MQEREHSGSPRSTTIHKGTIRQRQTTKAKDAKTHIVSDESRYEENLGQNATPARSDTLMTDATYKNKRVSGGSDEARFQAHREGGTRRESNLQRDTIIRKSDARYNDPRRSDTVTTDATVQNRHGHEIRYSAASAFGMKLMGQ